MTSVGQGIIEALREGSRPRLIEAIRKLRDMLGSVDLGRVLELLKGLMSLLDDIGILPPATASADAATIEAACAEAVAGDATAQALDLASFMAIVKLVVELIRRFTKPAA